MPCCHCSSSRNSATVPPSKRFPTLNLSTTNAALQNLADLCEGFLPRAFAEGHVQPLPPDDVPDPFNRLLVHQQHMTQVLNEHYGESVALEVLQHRQQGDWYGRMILLRLPSDNRIVEFGIVRLNLSAIDAQARHEILERGAPLGDILIRHDVLRRIEPKWYLRFNGGSPPADYCPISPGQPAYGRLGTIHCNDAPAIELLEIVTNVSSSNKNQRDVE